MERDPYSGIGLPQRRKNPRRSDAALARAREGKGTKTVQKQERLERLERFREIKEIFEFIFKFLQSLLATHGDIRGIPRVLVTVYLVSIILLSGGLASEAHSFGGGSGLTPRPPLEALEAINLSGTSVQSGIGQQGLGLILAGQSTPKPTSKPPTPIGTPRPQPWGILQGFYTGLEKYGVVPPLGQGRWQCPGESTEEPEDDYKLVVECFMRDFLDALKILQDSKRPFSERMQILVPLFAYLNGFNLLDTKGEINPNVTDEGLVLTLKVLYSLSEHLGVESGLDFSTIYLRGSALTEETINGVKVQVGNVLLLVDGYVVGVYPPNSVIGEVQTMILEKGTPLKLESGSLKIMNLYLPRYGPIVHHIGYVGQPILLAELKLNGSTIVIAFGGGLSIYDLRQQETQATRPTIIESEGSGEAGLRSPSDQGSPSGNKVPTDVPGGGVPTPTGGGVPTDVPDEP